MDPYSDLGVRGGPFFWPHYPGESRPLFDHDRLQRLAEHAAQSLDLAIYGGDAIIAPDGTLQLIDLNDWPSFAPCREAAAQAIAQLLTDSCHALKIHSAF